MKSTPGCGSVWDGNDRGDEKATKASSKEVKCAGVNEWKGLERAPARATAAPGQNGCKGQGWVTVKSTKECTD